MTPAGFSHSEISGLKPVCDSPELIAANYVLHRLLTPRHPSCALSSLTTNLLVDDFCHQNCRDTPLMICNLTFRFQLLSRSKLAERTSTFGFPSTLVFSQDTLSRRRRLFTCHRTSGPFDHRQKLLVLKGLLSIFDALFCFGGA